MRDWQKKRYWIIGASEGLGRAVAEKLSRVGVSLVLSARSEDRLTELADALPGRAEAVPCDVTDADSVARAFEQVGEIDGIVYLAGLCSPLSSRDWKTEEVIEMAEVNYLGACRVLGHVVPMMVARDRGHVVLAGALSGHRGLPNSIGYGASKAGVMVLAEGMRADLRDTGVEVQLVNPGFIRSRRTEKDRSGTAHLMEPEAAAQQVFEHMSSDNFVRNFPSGRALAIRALNFLPTGLYYRIVS